MTKSYNLFNRIDNAKDIGNLRNSNYPCLGIQQRFQFVKIKMPLFINVKDLQCSPFPLAEHLPRNNVGMMLGLGNDDLIAFPDESLTERKGDKVDGSSRSRSEYHLFTG